MIYYIREIYIDTTWLNSHAKKVEGHGLTVHKRNIQFIVQTKLNVQQNNKLCHRQRGGFGWVFHQTNMKKTGLAQLDLPFPLLVDVATTPRVCKESEFR